MLFTLKVIISIIMALIPALVWGYIFYLKEPQPRKWILITGVLGMLSVTPIMIYKWLWQFFPDLNIFLYTSNFSHHLIGIKDFFTVPLSIILAFMFVGIIEEYMKHLVVKFIDKNKFNDIDDVILHSIIAALGFAFVENILYFVFIWENQGFQNLLIAFIFRSLFSTFAHVLFSGIFGYFYGIALFAEPIYKEHVGRKRPILIRFIHKILYIKGATIFEEEKTGQGLIYAMILHAVFNILLELNYTLLVVPFLIIGYFYLSYLFDLKDSHKKYKELAKEEVQI